VSFSEAGALRDPASATLLTLIKNDAKGAAHTKNNFKKERFPMNKQQAAPFQTLLRALRAALLEQISEQRGGTLSRAEAASDHFAGTEDSSAQMATARALEFAIGERETAELEAIDAALARIEADNYGDCIDCGVDIAPARLEARPEAPRCIRCQEKMELRRSA
jgi:DnaK suppressor protein